MRTFTFLPVAITTAILAVFPVANAHRRGGAGGLLVPRSYEYSRRHRDPFDLVSDFFSMPFYSSSPLAAATNSLIRQSEAQLDRLARSTSPRYSVDEDPETGIVELAVELPGVSAKDLTIELESDRVLRIRGSRRYKSHGTTYESEFDQSFELENVDPEKLTATLSDGILRVQVPKKVKSVKKIEIAFHDTEDDSQMLPTKPVMDAEHASQDEGVVKAEEVKKTVEEIDGLTISEGDDEL